MRFTSYTDEGEYVSKHSIDFTILKHEEIQYLAGGISNRLAEWKILTTDRIMLEIIEHGLKIDFITGPTYNFEVSHPVSQGEQNIINHEIITLPDKQVISPCTREPGDFISPIFTRTKKDGKRRMILNLKKLNTFVAYKHFKMEHFQNVLEIIKPGVWMASVDLKDAFYSIPIHESHQKYLKFNWGGIYKFNVMPNGYGPAMRVFTKLMKIPFSHLRHRGHLSVYFVDDSYLQGDTKLECYDNVKSTIQLLRKLGFVIHTDKSVLEPTQIITFLGFIINSYTMTITLTEDKKTENS